MSKLTKALTAAAGNAGESLYVEDVFSTYLYTGTGAAQTITNGIDLDGEGGLVWLKGRSGATGILNWDTTMSPYNNLSTYNTDAIIDQTSPFGIASANADGFSIGDTNWSRVNASGSTYASWTFRKAEKFFDVVTYTGTGTTRTVSHNLGSTPAVIIIKRLDAAVGWPTYHEANGNTGLMYLNTTAAKATSTSAWGSTSPTATEFTVGTNVNNISGGQFVAYLFASDAGGFGDDGSESIIKCGSYTGNGGTQEINLGFEPQWLLVKSSTQVDSWFLTDTMRGMPNNAPTPYLLANLSNAEADASAGFFPQATATGFKIGASGSVNASGQTFIYIAIRRPMKTPESGTEVFKPSFRITGDPTVDTGFVTDMGIVATRTGGGTSDYHLIGSRLTGNLGMTTTSTSAEVSRGLEPLKWDYNDGWGGSDTASSFAVWYSFKRATGFFDVVAYTGDGVAGSTQAHNLGVVPECMIVKRRDGASSWITYWDALGATKGQFLDTNQAFTSSSYWNDTAPTATQLTLGSGSTNNSGATFIAYLFASLAGVSKVGSYTGTGADLNVDCGFSAGARFILIKRTDSTGDWYVWDSARGIVAGNDPYLLLNSTAAEVTTTDYIDPLASGFTVTSSAPAALNASGGSYIFLAIA